MGVLLEWENMGRKDGGGRDSLRFVYMIWIIQVFEYASGCTFNSELH